VLWLAGLTSSCASFAWNGGAGDVPRGLPREHGAVVVDGGLIESRAVHFEGPRCRTTSPGGVVILGAPVPLATRAIVCTTCPWQLDSALCPGGSRTCCACGRRRRRREGKTADEARSAVK
jgi:hypothetical protein